jgi:hypothetical protein
MECIRVTPDSAYWDGKLSSCKVGGSIESFVATTLARLPASCILSKSDGFLGQSEYDRLCSEFGRQTDALTKESRYAELERMKRPGTYPLIGCLCSRFMDRSNLIHLPLDDETFRVGLEQVLSGIARPAWEDRESTMFWRGGSSGLDRPCLRVRVATNLYGHPNTNARITPWGNWENEQGIPTELFAPRCDIADHFRYKYLLIVDGNCIASNHQWVFGSGAVPIMITHPQNRYWFQSHLKPMVNYVPIQYDLSDLKEKIDWLVANDAEAKMIAQNALELSRTIFTPEFQQRYIATTIRTVLYGTNAYLYSMYEQKARLPSDINEHLPTLHAYAKKCKTIVECGVREVVSSYAFASGLVDTPNNSLTMIDLYESASMKPFLEKCREEGVNASFVTGSDTTCEPIETDMLFIDTWHVYGHLKRELAHWHSHVRMYILLHDTTVDAEYGESIRGGFDTAAQARESGYPEAEIRKGLWPAVVEFLAEHPEWKLEMRYTHNNGLTVLART